MTIPFNRIFLTGKEQEYVSDVLSTGHLSGNGKYTHLCIDFFKKNYGINFPFLTHSCTGALEMAALLLDVKEGDEIIFPSYTFVSTVNAFILRGAIPVFADSCAAHPNIDPDSIEQKISSKTKGIVVVHYAGMACEMNRIRSIAEKNNLWIVEDAAQAVDAFYNDEVLGTIGDCGTYSFHDTKNIIAGEAGLLIVKNKLHSERAELLGEKGTNRSAFLRKEVNEYSWKDIGSTYYPPETSAAILFAQLQVIKEITQRRMKIWSLYDELLNGLKKNSEINFPEVKEYMRHNAQHYFFTLDSKELRDKFLKFLKEKNIHATSHFRPLHLSDFHLKKHKLQSLPNAEKFGNGLIRLPLFTTMKEEETEFVANSVKEFFN